MQFDFHREILRSALLRALEEDVAMGFMVSGSVARGNALPGSDLDLFILLEAEHSRRFRAEVHDGVLVEVTRTDLGTARTRLEERPMEVYRYLDGRILYDRDGTLVELADGARKRFDDYRTPAQEKERLAYWLGSACMKAKAAREAGDTLRAGFVVATNSWQLLEALWAANDRPMPPAGSVFAHLSDLRKTPPGLEGGLRELFSGNSARGRVDATIALMDVVLELLGEAVARKPFL